MYDISELIAPVQAAAPHLRVDTLDNMSIPPQRTYLAFYNSKNDI